MSSAILVWVRRDCARCMRTHCIEKGGHDDCRFFAMPDECWNFLPESVATDDSAFAAALVDFDAMAAANAPAGAEPALV